MTMQILMLKNSYVFAGNVTADGYIFDNTYPGYCDDAFGAGPSNFLNGNGFGDGNGNLCGEGYGDGKREGNTA